MLHECDFSLTFASLLMCSTLSLFQTGSLRWNRIHVHLPLYLSRLCWPVAIKSSLKCHFNWASVPHKYQGRSMWFREVDGVKHDDVHRMTQTDFLSSQWKAFFFYLILCDSLPESRQSYVSNWTVTVHLQSGTLAVQTSALMLIFDWRGHCLDSSQESLVKYRRYINECSTLSSTESVIGRPLVLQVRWWAIWLDFGWTICNLHM